MLIKIPYGTDTVQLEIDDANVSEIIESRKAPVKDEAEIINAALEHPVNAPRFKDFLTNAQDILIVVNDATRPTPTARLLDIIHEDIRSSSARFIIATGAHRAPTGNEYEQIFGEHFEEFRSRILVHDSRSAEDMVYIGTSRNGTEMHVNSAALEAHKIIIIGSVEPHYFAGYTGGRKSFLPGLASYESIEQNHKLALNPMAKALTLDGNPVHEDMVDALGTIRNKEIFSIMTVLDKDHRIYAATAGDIDDSFLVATKKANDVFAVNIAEKGDIVISVAKYPMDIDLYQSQKAIENGILAVKKGGILILVSKCRCGMGDDTFAKLLCRCDTPQQALQEIEDEYVLGYHKAGKMAEASMMADLYCVTDLPNDTITGLFLTPFPSLQEAVDHALKVKGRSAKVLVLLDGTMTVPISG
jgi:nickel-dependent lactate racemase